jgi:hypothetical protein
MFSERKLGLSAERLRELLHYARKRGFFIGACREAVRAPGRKPEKVARAGMS